MTGWDQPVMRPQVKVPHGLLRFASPDIWESDIPPRVEGHERGGGHPQCCKQQNVGANGATNQNQSLISVISENDFRTQVISCVQTALLLQRTCWCPGQ